MTKNFESEIKTCKTLGCHGKIWCMFIEKEGLSCQVIFLTTNFKTSKII